MGQPQLRLPCDTAVIPQFLQKALRMLQIHMPRHIRQRGVSTGCFHDYTVILVEIELPVSLFGITAGVSGIQQADAVFFQNIIYGISLRPVPPMR